MIPSQSILPRKIDAGIPRTVYPSSSIQTILSVLELHQILPLPARGLYRRSGISPCPEDICSLFSFRSRQYTTIPPKMQGPVSGRPKLSQAVCAVCSCAPGVINHHPGGAALQSRAECHRKGWLCPPRQKALLYKGVFLGYLAPVGTPPGGWKKVGEKPSFSPRASGGVSFRYDRYFGLVPK